MPALPEVQAMFGETVRSPVPGRYGLLGDLVDRIERLDIYRNNTLITLGEALRTTFPVVGRLVGDDFFDFAARRFILACPPQRPCLFEYGVAFPDFLEGMPECAPLPYLGDIARLEWALNAVVTAPDEPALSPHHLVGLPEDTLSALTLRLVPSARYLTSPFPIDAIWRANQGDGTEIGAVDLKDGEVDLLILRLGDEAAMTELAPGEYHFLTALDGGLPLGTAAFEAATFDSTFDVGTSFARLLAAPVFAEIPALSTGVTVP
ncbi:MAG: hypothetical protein FD176_3116 [Rhodospirillaceae bacterium]|nr:MAG: hypothetical protein FD176_3116 [Rhodospirillaceae bacterium]TNC98553.1 MAG: hypothetical protein FD119_24 [Stygiobacter sp.]